MVFPIRTAHLIRTLHLLLALALAFAGCARESEVEPAVATPGLSVSPPRAPLGSPLEVTYRFTVASNAPVFKQNYRALVHFLDADEELMWTDDHEPAVPTTQWKPGQKVEYIRTTFVPVYPYIGEATIVMGLYSPRDQSRLLLAGEDRGQRSYKVATLQLLPQSENVFLIYKNGWHPSEIAHDNPAIEWQWTKKEAVITFRNPRRSSLFYVHLDGRPDVFPEPQHVTFKIGDQIVDSVTIASREEIIRKIPLSTEQLGSSDIIEILIQVDKTFVPATLSSSSRDPRELGVRVFHAYLKPS